MFDNFLVAPVVVNAICADCTLLLPGSDEDVRCILVLCKVNQVGIYLTRGK